MNADSLMAYWSAQELMANGIILLHLLGALAVGVIVGYERSYHGRAAGMRTYALVCLASTALTVIMAYPTLWFGGQVQAESLATADPTRVIQGLMTGIGFLGAGVILREGFTIRGLSTAASIWMTAAIGIMIGVGFYAAAIFAALITALIMSGVRYVERILPHRAMLQLSLVYQRGRVQDEGDIRRLAGAHGFDVGDWSFQTTHGGERFEYHLVLQTADKGRVNDLARTLASTPEIVEFRLSPTRN